MDNVLEGELTQLDQILVLAEAGLQGLDVHERAAGLAGHERATELQHQDRQLPDARVQLLDQLIAALHVFVVGLLLQTQVHPTVFRLFAQRVCQSLRVEKLAELFRNVFVLAELGAHGLVDGLLYELLDAC